MLWFLHESVCKIICCSPSPVFCCSRVWTILVSSCLLLLRHGNRPSPPCTSCTIRCGNRPLVVVAYISHTLVSKADLSHVLVDIVVGVLTSSRLVVDLYIYQSKAMEKSSSGCHTFRVFRLVQVLCSCALLSIPSSTSSQVCVGAAELIARLCREFQGQQADQARVCSTRSESLGERTEIINT